MFKLEFIKGNNELNVNFKIIFIRMNNSFFSKKCVFLILVVFKMFKINKNFIKISFKNSVIFRVLVGFNIKVFKVVCKINSMLDCVLKR